MARYTYPLTLERDGKFVLAQFVDVPQAHTQGATEAEALAAAPDCLIAALGGTIEAKQDIPAPSPARGRPTATLPPLVAAKIALYQAMREAGLNNVQLAKRLGLTENAVRRLLDLDHRSHIGQLEAALSILGKKLVIEVRDAA